MSSSSCLDRSDHVLRQNISLLLFFFFFPIFFFRIPPSSVLSEIVTAHHPCLCFRWWWKVATGWSGVTCRSWIRSAGMTGWISTAWLRLSSNRSSNRWMRVRAIFLLVLVWFLVFMQRWWETDSPVSECLESSPSLDNSVTSLHLLF